MTLEENAPLTEETRHQHWLDVENVNLKRLELQIKQQEVLEGKKQGRLRISHGVVAVVFTLIGGISTTLIQSNTDRNLAAEQSNREFTLQKELAQHERDLQDLQFKKDLIVQSTNGVDNQAGAKNLMFFVDAGLLDDPDGKIRQLAENGKTPEFGPIQPANQLTSGRDALAIIKLFTPVHLTKKTLPNGIEIIGYNHWVRSSLVLLDNGDYVDVSKGEVSQSEAEALLRHDLREVENAINMSVKVPLTQSQFDALASFASDVGIREFQASDVLTAINEQRFKEVPALLSEWVYVGNAKSPERVDRRTQEARLWEHVSR